MSATPEPRLFFRLWEQIFQVRPGEFARVHLFLLFLATIMAFWTIGSTVGDTLFLSHLGGGEALRLLPWLFIGTAVAAVAVTGFTDFIQGRVPRTALLVGLFLALAASLVGMRFVIRLEKAWLYLVLAVWLEACGILAITLFFSFLGDFFTSRDARRLYGYINGGMALGGIAGGYAVGPLVGWMGAHNLLLVGAGCLVAAAAWTIVVRNVATPVPTEPERPNESRPALRTLLGNGYLRWIGAVVLLACVVFVLVSYRFKLVAGREMKEDELAAYFGRFYALLGIAQFVLQFVVVGWLLRRAGVVRSLLLLPILLLLADAAFLARPVLLMAALSNFVRLAFLDTLDQPARELLFLPLTNRIRLRAQAFVGGALIPLGNALGGLLLLGVTRFVSDVRWLAPVSLVLAAVWALCVLRLAPQYRRTLMGSLRGLTWNAPDVSRALDSREGMRVVSEMITSDDPEKAGVSLELWRDRPLGALAPLLWNLTSSPHDDVAIRAIRLLGKDGHPSHLAALRRAMYDARIEVRAAAVLAYLQVGQDEAVPDVRSMIESEHEPVRVSVLVGCALHGGFEGGIFAYPQIDRLVNAGEPARRIEAIRVLTQIAGHGATRVFLQLLDDPSPEVRREAVIAARSLRDPGLFRSLVHQLDDAHVRPLVALALEALPAEHSAMLAARARDRERPLPERCVLARILGTVGGRDSAEGLWDLMGPEHDLVLRHEAGVSLRRLKAREGLRGMDLRGLDQRALRLCEEIALLNEAAAEVSAREPVRARLYEDHARLKLGVLLSFVALDRDEEAVQRVEAGLFSDSPTKRANAVELLEMILPHGSAERIVALLTPPEPPSRAGLSEETKRRLLNSEPWTRAITLLNGAHPPGGETMNDPETRLYRTLSTVSFLKQVELFREVPAHYLTSLAEIVEPVAFAAGERIFGEGDPGDACYLVSDGRVKVQSSGVEIAALGRGECLGELALLDGQPRSASAVVEEDARLLRILSDDFRNLVATHSGIALGLLKTMARRLRENVAKTTSMSQRLRLPDGRA